MSDKKIQITVTLDEPLPEVDGFEHTYEFRAAKKGESTLQYVSPEFRAYTWLRDGGPNEKCWILRKKRWVPKMGEQFWIADLTIGDLATKYIWHDDSGDQRFLGSNILFKTEAQASECSLRMLETAKAFTNELVAKGEL